MLDVKFLFNDRHAVIESATLLPLLQIDEQIMRSRLIL